MQTITRPRAWEEVFPAIPGSSDPEGGRRPRLSATSRSDNSRRVERLAILKKCSKAQGILSCGVNLAAFQALHQVVHGQVHGDDASGTFNSVAREAADLRMAAVGVQLLNWFAIACELHRDWRNDIEGLGSLFAQHIPDYANLISSFAARNRDPKASDEMIQYLSVDEWKLCLGHHRSMYSLGELCEPI